MHADETTAALKALGFSEIEALVYCFLLGNSPATGYRISKGVGKAAANVYAAIETLAQKGALLIDNDATRLCRATPPKELCDSLEARFKNQRREAETALQALTAETPDQHIYKLETPEQVFSRIKQMIAGASDYILVDAFPEPLREINSFLEEASERGVSVAIETYNDDVETPYALTAQSSYDVRSLALWPGRQINIVVDAREFVLALFNQQCDGVLQAVWSTSGYLACLQHSHMAASLLARQCENDGLLNSPKLRRLRKLALTAARPPGLEQFMQFYATDADGEQYGE